MKKTIELTAALMPCIATFAGLTEEDFDKPYSVVFSTSQQLYTPLAKTTTINPVNFSVGCLYDFDDWFSLKGEGIFSSFVGLNDYAIQLTPHLYPWAKDRFLFRPYLGIGIRGGYSHEYLKLEYDDQLEIHKCHEWKWDMVPMIGVEFYKTNSTFCFAQFEYHIDTEQTQLSVGIGF